MSPRGRRHRRSSPQAGDTPTTPPTVATPGSAPEAPDPPLSPPRPDVIHHGVSRKEFDALRERVMQLGHAQDHVVHTVTQARLAVAPIADLRAVLTDLARVVQRDERVGLAVAGLLACLILALSIAMAWWVVTIGAV